MSNVIILKECNKKNICKVKKCVHNVPHNRYDSCDLELCKPKEKYEYNCKCLKHQYKLIKIRG